MGSIYDVDINRLLKLLLPMRWRQVGLLAMGKALTTPITGMPAKLKDYKAECEYRMRYSGQVCRLRGLLNDEFDCDKRRITVTDSKSSFADGYIFVYSRKEGKYEVQLPCEIRERSNPQYDIGDFDVNVPMELKEKELRIKALINEYKLASKRYKINYI
ncbi:MAG: hypothetical protein IJY31_03355 [Muribaculaceae bacterium]|nr:hypothetical protein [Muribaculaceae bacterium]